MKFINEMSNWLDANEGRRRRWAYKAFYLGRSLVSIILVDVLTDSLVGGLADVGLWSWVATVAKVAVTVVAEKLSVGHSYNHAAGERDRPDGLERDGDRGL
ncbi:hypothetical protein [Nocardia fluminea]|uniref:hypothetical protein n=1 Tax=Nocardia fluminea TaxID=134984 RepID=UPI003D0DFA76